MNQRIAQLQQQATEDILGVKQLNAKTFAELIIKDMLDRVMDINVNRCALTTYDLSVAECTRTELVKALKDFYDVDYQIMCSSQSTFPVSSTVKTL